MSKIQDVPFITKVIDTLSDELKSGLYDLIDGQVKTPIFRSLVNNDYAITEANDKGKVQFVTLETLRGNYTGYLAYNSVYCVLIAFKGNTQALDMLNINVAKHTFAFVNESLSILELRVELEDGKKGVTPTDLGATNNNIHLAKGTKQIGEGINLKTLDGNTLIGSGNVGFKTINDQEIVGDGNIVVGEGGTIAIDTALSDSSTNPVQNKVVTSALNTKLALPNTAPTTRKVVTIGTNGAQDNVDGTELNTALNNIVDNNHNQIFEKLSNPDRVKVNYPIEDTALTFNFIVNGATDTSKLYASCTYCDHKLHIVISGTFTCEAGADVSMNTTGMLEYIANKIHNLDGNVGPTSWGTIRYIIGYKSWVPSNMGTFRLQWASTTRNLFMSLGSFSEAGDHSICAECTLEI